MQFLGAEAEREFRLHFHRQRVPQDRVFACTQMGIVALLLLRSSGPLPPPLRLLYWGTYALSLAVLALSFCARRRYPAMRPHLLVAARVFYDLLCPQLVWHLASQNVGRSVERGSWPSFFLLWVTWTRWGSELLTQVGFLLPFNLEALLTPFGALLDMLNNRRLCRLLMAGEASEAQRFYRDAFARLASRLTVPFEMLFAAAPDSSCSTNGGEGCGWSLCTAGATAGGPAAADGAPVLPPSPTDVAACYCESVFSMTQVVLSVALPLLLLGCAEASQRRQFAACQLSAAAQREEAERSRAPRRRRRRSGSAAWCITYDGMRLLALLTLIQFRVFLSLRFGVWQNYSFGASGTSETAAAPVHSEL
ncbi:inner-membrane translocator [Chlorella sorokiniana]|uniref:Inner-membrane translocator n=1 Tax=Chlorella sorokiniana TaxID=3076 RepID=A0A2P6TE72_CHLSO|nr:inner-membrane translocator [Chlorella sorokiniana]|eukprot:PRW20944.1 inner-membrane translocator [Chlorella sorokiniana]